MKKMNRNLLAACVAGGILLGGANVSQAAEISNPLASVPQDHWAYSAVEKLVNDGLVDGYNDGEFKGDRPISRYEMAILVAKAMSNLEKADAEDQASIQQLSKEFGDELKNLGVRMDKLESKISNVKMYGDARLRYFKNKTMSASNGQKLGNTSQLEERLRLGLYADIDKNLSFTGRLKSEQVSHKQTPWEHGVSGTSGDDDWDYAHTGVYVDLLGLKWASPSGTNVEVGRIELSLGQGGLWWENPVDGVAVSKDFGKVNVKVGYGDLVAENWHKYEDPAFFANISAPVSDKTTITASMLKTNGDSKNSIKHSAYKNGGWQADYTVPFNLEQYALGVNHKFSDKLSIFVEGIKNQADAESSDKNYGGTDDNKGWWTRLTYGNQKWNEAKTWQVYGEYFSLGGLAVDSSGWGHRMNIAGGNGYGGDGAKGYGIGASYMVAANTNLELTYYKLKPYDEDRAGFDKYDTVGYAALTYSF